MYLDIAYAYDLCKRVTRAEAKNFYHAFITLPAERRRAIFAAYAYCRICDDIADEVEEPTAFKLKDFAALRAELDRALEGRSRDPILIAVADSVDRFGFTREHLLEVIEGVEMDLVKTRFADFGELREYCYKVASVVGLISIEIFGYSDPAARKYAVDLGLAMQLTNIMRDIREDADRDRIYIPQDEMESFGYSEADLKAGVVDERFRGLMRAQAGRARAYFDSGSRLFDLLDPESRICPALLHAMYSTLLTRIESSGFDVFSRRIGLSTREKILMVGRIWAVTMARYLVPRRG